MRKVFVCISKYQGSNNQLLSLAKVGFPDCQIVSISVELRFRNKLFVCLSKLVAKFILLLGSNSIISIFLKKIFLKGSDVDVGISDGDIFFLKTAPFEVPALLLTSGYSVSLILLGKPRRLPRKSFALTISTPSTWDDFGSVQLASLPSAFCYSDFPEKNQESKTGVWVMLLGGDARGFSYKENDWDLLLDSMTYYANKCNIKWLVSSSPRTPVSAVNKLILAANSQNVDVFLKPSIYGEDSQKSLFDCLRIADVVFVTEDSASMVCDAVNSRLPVVCLRPDDSGYNVLTTPQAKNYHKMDVLHRLKISEIMHADIIGWVLNKHSPLMNCWSEQWRNYIKSKKL